MNRCLICENECKNKFCSYSCNTINNNKNRKWTKEQKEKVSLSQKGKILSKETKDKISKSSKGKKLSQDHKLKLSISRKNDINNKIRNSGKNNPFYGKKHSEETKQKFKNRKITQETREKLSKIMSQRLANNTIQVNKGSYLSTKTNEKNYYDSNYELKRMKFLDNNENVKYWTKRHKIILKLPNGKRYIPDFIVEMTNGKKFLEEIKGWVRDKEEFEMKNNCAIQYCKENNIEFRILFGKELEKI